MDAQALKTLPLIFFAYFISLPAYGAGKIVMTKGEVTLDQKSVQKMAVFKTGQKIQVAKSSLAIIRFDNGNTLKVNENTELVLESTQNNKGKGSVFNLLKGSSFFSKNKDNKETMTVKASSASMGVRGTTFFVSYGVAKPEDIYMCVQKGVVAVKGGTDAKEVLVKEGEGVVISSGKKTSTPKFLPWTKNLNWKLSPKEKDLINKASIEESYNDMLDKDYD